MAEALERGAPSVGSIAYLLDQDSRDAGRPVPLEVDVPEHVCAKDVIVVPHDMSDYDQLGVEADDVEADDVEEDGS